MYIYMYIYSSIHACNCCMYIPCTVLDTTPTTDDSEGLVDLKGGVFFDCPDVIGTLPPRNIEGGIMGVVFFLFLIFFLLELLLLFSSTLLWMSTSILPLLTSFLNVFLFFDKIDSLFFVVILVSRFLFFG